jgi:alpha-D-ribose 1-methylphosphonate 5-phosphate C-P lyase
MTETGYNFAYLDEQTKRMIRRAILKAVAIPGYQVPFAGREMPLPYGWGTGGIQVTAAVLGPDDVLKVIDQGADDTTNAVSIRRFFARTAGVATTAKTVEATVIQTRHRIPETKLTERQIIVYQVPIPEPLRWVEPRETETRKMHALLEYGAVADPEIRQSEDGHDAGPAALRRRAREAYLCRAALHAGPKPRFRGSSLRGAELGRMLRAVRLDRVISRRGRDRRRRHPYVRLLRHRLLRRAARGRP